MVNVHDHGVPLRGRGGRDRAAHALGCVHGRAFGARRYEYARGCVDGGGNAHGCGCARGCASNPRGYVHESVYVRARVFLP